MRNNCETSTGRNIFAQYKVKNGFYSLQKIFKKSYQFHKYANAYFRKGRYAPDSVHLPVKENMLF